jgi:hypothetical protein
VATFVVECYWPGITEDEVREALARIARAPSAPQRRETRSGPWGASSCTPMAWPCSFSKAHRPRWSTIGAYGQRSRSTASWRPFGSNLRSNRGSRTADRHRASSGRLSGT